jgi:3-oxoacyl-[acyl-carrier-protein] synthase-3
MFAIRKSDMIYRELRDEYAAEGRKLHFIAHQANLRMLQAVCKRCSIPAELHHSNVESRGNTASAGSPAVLSERWDEWDDTDDIAVVGVGGGLTWGGYLLRFGSTS